MITSLISSYLSLAVRLLQLLQMCRHFNLKVDFAAVLWAGGESDEEEQQQHKGYYFSLYMLL